MVTAVIISRSFPCKGDSYRMKIQYQYNSALFARPHLHMNTGRKGYLAVKRLMDVVLSAAALAVIGPFLLLLALIIWLDDPHASPFFVQTRVGKDGREFRFYKLRSMVSNAEELLEQLKDRNEMDGPAFKMENDPRITRIGRFIRKTSIDELPQFFNVLKDRKSVV